VIGSTLIRVASVNAVPKAPIEVAKQIAPAEISAGFRPGMSTSSTTRHGAAPRERAASSSFGSSFSAAAITVRITRGMEK
jgi:hypothetical protein